MNYIEPKPLTKGDTIEFIAPAGPIRDKDAIKRARLYFEKQGFVRLNELPYKTADYDFLKVDTYPTRRWRDAEITSRW